MKNAEDRKMPRSHVVRTSFDKGASYGLDWTSPLCGALPSPRHACALPPYFRASKMRLNGVAVARRKRVKPASLKTFRSRASPACAPNPRPTSWESEFGVQMNVDAA